MGSTRFRARIRRALVSLVLGAALAAGGALATPTPASAASSASAFTAPAPGDESPSHVGPLDEESTAALPLGLVSAGVLAVAIGGLALEMRRRRPQPTAE